MFSRTLTKSQQKRDTYRILGSMDGEQALKQNDENIFNDHDYYQLVLNDFLSGNDKGSITELNSDPTGNNGNADFLFGADLSLT